MTSLLKKLTLAIIYLFLYLNAWTHQHYQELLLSLPYFFSLHWYASLNFLNNGLFLVKGGTGGGGFVLSKQQKKSKRAKRNGSKLFLCSLCEKNCLIFQTGTKVLSDKFLGSCWLIRANIYSEGRGVRCKINRDEQGGGGAKI